MNESVLSCIELLTSSARAFRLGMEAHASQALIRFIDLFFPIIQDLGLPSRTLMNKLLEKTVAAQSAKDYLRVADLLEYEIATQIEKAQQDPKRQNRK